MVCRISLTRRITDFKLWGTIFYYSGAKEGRSKSADEEEDDVRTERQRIEAGGKENDIIKILDLTKDYAGMMGKPTRAVDRISVGIKEGEVRIDAFILRIRR